MTFVILKNIVMLKKRDHKEEYFAVLHSKERCPEDFFVIVFFVCLWFIHKCLSLDGTFFLHLFRLSFFISTFYPVPNVSSKTWKSNVLFPFHNISKLLALSRQWMGSSELYVVLCKVHITIVRVCKPSLFMHETRF